MEVVDCILPIFFEMNESNFFIVYIYAYLIYNISMNVKLNHKQKIREMMESQNGVIFTSDLAKFNIPREYLSLMEKNGEIERISRGIYTNIDSLPDEMFFIQAIYKNTIFSHETALYLLDLSDRTPIDFSVTVPSGYNATALKENRIKVYFINRKHLTLGLTNRKSGFGNPIRSYNMERTICDIVRNRNQIDIQILNDALKRYALRKEKNIDLLYEYAKKLRVFKIIREYIELML